MNETMAIIEVVYVAKIFDDNGLVIAQQEYTNYRDAREFVKGSLFNNEKPTISNREITECEQFINEIKNGKNVEIAGLYDLVKRPDGSLKNYYV